MAAFWGRVESIPWRLWIAGLSSSGKSHGENSVMTTSGIWGYPQFLLKIN
jgi:adenylylsulfate kinase-like enzyme